jgi:hypothetical protein
MIAVRRPRGRSCPVKPSSEPRVKCLYFHRYGRCVWGSFCRFQHEPPKIKYREVVNCFLPLPQPPTLDLNQLFSPLALELPRLPELSPPSAPAQRNLKYRAEIRKAQI